MGILWAHKNARGSITTFCCHQSGIRLHPWACWVGTCNTTSLSEIPRNYFVCFLCFSGLSSFDRGPLSWSWAVLLSFSSGSSSRSFPPSRGWRRGTQPVTSGCTSLVSDRFSGLSVSWEDLWVCAVKIIERNHCGMIFHFTYYKNRCQHCNLVQPPLFCISTVSRVSAHVDAWISQARKWGVGAYTENPSEQITYIHAD